MKRLSVLVVLLLLSSLFGCGQWDAKYGKCYQCGALYGHRGGNLPGQGTRCQRCGGNVYYPAHKSAEYYENKRAYGGSED